jgi:hypothetical protein
MNLHPNCRARASPSARVNCQRSVRPPIVGKLMPTLFRHHSLSLEIALVADDDDGEVVLVLHPENLLLECHDFLE